MPGPKPKLEKLTTPVTSNFPSQINSANTATPLSALPLPCKPDPDFIKTPISPPLAYTDFLTKAMSRGSPVVVSAGASPDASPESAPPTDSSEKADSAKDEHSPATSTPSSKASPTTPPTPPTPPKLTVTASEKASAIERALASASNSPVPPSPFSKVPMSAPPTGITSFPSLKVPASPAIANIDSPLSAASSLRSPYSARSIHSSVFDWDAALKARYAEQKRSKSSRSVRHIREVVTRTVTYTPRMEPAPRGKRRKVE